MPDRPPTERERALAAKARWHDAQAKLTLREKVCILLELQRQDYPVLAARRIMEPWERPWEIEP